MNQVKVEVTFTDGSPAQFSALNGFLQTLTGSNPGAAHAPSPLKAGHVGSPESVATESAPKTTAKAATPAAKASQAVKNAASEFEDDTDFTSDGSDITLDEVKIKMNAKIKKHRDPILAKFSEYGTKNISSLPAQYYADFVEFLQALPA